MESYCEDCGKGGFIEYGTYYYVVDDIPIHYPCRPCPQCDQVAHFHMSGCDRKGVWSEYLCCNRHGFILRHCRICGEKFPREEFEVHCHMTKSARKES